MNSGHITAGTGLGVRGVCADGRARTGGGKPRPIPTGGHTQTRCGRNQKPVAAPAHTALRGGSAAPSAGGS